MSNTHKGSRPSSNAHNRADSTRRVEESEGLTIHVGSLHRDVTENELSDLLELVGYSSVMYVKVCRLMVTIIFS